MYTYFVKSIFLVGTLYMSIGMGYTEVLLVIFATKIIMVISGGAINEMEYIDWQEPRRTEKVSVKEWYEKKKEWQQTHILYVLYTLVHTDDDGIKKLTNESNNNCSIVAYKCVWFCLLNIPFLYVHHITKLL